MSSGSTSVQKQSSLSAKWVAQLDVATFFDVSEISSDNFIKVASDVEIAGFEVVKTVDQDLLGLNAQSEEDQLTNL